MSATTVSFVGVLCRSCRFLLPVLAEHLDEQDGEVLAHLFMADVERWAEAALADGRTDELRQLLHVLETEVTGPDDDVHELIAVSFVEHLPQPGEPGSELRALIGPHCSAYLAE